MAPTALKHLAEVAGRRASQPVLSSSQQESTENSHATIRRQSEISETTASEYGAKPTHAPPSKMPRRTQVGTVIGKLGAKTSAYSGGNKKIVSKKLHIDDFIGADELESDEEYERNRVGNIPLWYYNDQEHIGYDISGKRIEQKFRIQGSELDRLLDNADNPDIWRQVVDYKNQEIKTLSPLELELIRRVREGKLGPVALKEEDFQVEYEWTDSKQPLKNKPLRKAAFLPSRHEEKKIQHFIKLIRQGKLYRPREKQKPLIFDIWGESITQVHGSSVSDRRAPPPLPAPKLLAPGHAASYNPPLEYLMTEQEESEWREQHPDDRKLEFIPQRYSSLRHVPGYADNLKERFLRCLDLHLCPRQARRTWVEDAEEILPELRPLSQFRPFPQAVRCVFKTSGSRVSAVAFSPLGDIVAAGCQDGTLGLFDLATNPNALALAYLKATSRTSAFAVRGLCWHPTLPILAFSRAQYLFVVLVRPTHLELSDCREVLEKHWTVSNSEETRSDRGQGDHAMVEAVKLMRPGLSNIPAVTEEDRPKLIGGSGSWRSFRSDVFFNGFANADEEAEEIATELSEDEHTGHARLVTKDWAETVRFVSLLSCSSWVISGFVINIGSPATTVDFHRKGLYLASASPLCSTPSHQMLLHSLRKHASLAPLRRSGRGDRIESARFHPTRPWLCIGMQKSTKVYTLQPQDAADSKDEMGSLVKKFKGTDSGQDLEMHFSGEHLMRATGDGKLVWYDFEYGATPYRVIPLSNGSLNTVRLHPRRPLVAAGCSEGYVRLLHVSTEEGIMEEAVITPLVKLGEKVGRIYDVAWHPSQPWLVSGHADGSVCLWA